MHLFLLFLHLSGTTITNWHFGIWCWMKIKVRKSMCRIKQVLTERAIEEPDPRRSAEMKRMTNALWWLPTCVCSQNNVLGMFMDCNMASSFFPFFFFLGAILNFLAIHLHCYGVNGQIAPIHELTECLCSVFEISFTIVN